MFIIQEDEECLLFRKMTRINTHRYKCGSVILVQLLRFSSGMVIW